MEISIETDRKINKLIPKLLRENRIYSKEIKKRIKISSIFNEFEKKAKNDFNYFINVSNKRYNNSKNGQNIAHHLENSQPKYEDRISKIMKDKFYELNLKPEKEKIKHKSMKKIYGNIKDLITNIKSTLDSNKLRKNILSINYLNNRKNQKKMNRYKYNKCYTENELSLNKSTIDEKILFENKTKNDLKDIFTLDHIKIGNSIEKYKLRLSKIKIPTSQNVKEENLENKNLNINLPKIKLLYYHQSKPKIKEKDNNLEEINIHKFLPFSKYGRNLPKQKSENKVMKSEINSYFITETINPKLNYGSTNEIVIDSAKKNIRLKNNYSFKRYKIDEMLENNIPSLNDYENIIKDKLEKIKIRRHNINKELSKKQKLSFLSKRQLINLKIDQNIELLKEKEKLFE